MNSLGQPLCLQPIMMERVWGGNRLARLYGKELPPGKVIGESWELVDRPEAQSCVVGGPCHGKALGQLLASDPVSLLGSRLAAARPPRFPLLVKYVDAGAALSVQVHPDDAGARPFKDRGKSECWVIVHTEPGAQIVRGFKPGVTREAYEQAVAHDKVEELLHAFTPRAGDVIALPPGTVHAIGAGLVVAEIQQNSDLTFRIYDYKRLGLDGRPRQLHIQEAAASIRFEGRGREFAGDMSADTVLPLSRESRGTLAIEHLLDGIHFDLYRWTLQEGAATLEQDPDAPRAVLVVAGQGEMEGAPVRAGQTLLLPAAAAAVRVTAREGPLVFLVSRPTLAAC